MSMPQFPPEALEITCEQAFHMLLGSIAMEELALSHIMNAEGEKLQYLLGTLPGQRPACTTPRELLEVNRSIGDLLDKVAYNQILLKDKLRQVLEARDLCCPTPPDPPPEPPHPCLQRWTAEPGCWRQGSPVTWRPAEWGPGCWQGSAPGLLHLCPRQGGILWVSLRLHAEAEGPVQVALCRVHGRESTCLRVWETSAPPGGGMVHLSGSHPLPATGEELLLRLVLQQPDCLVLEEGCLNLRLCGG